MLVSPRVRCSIGPIVAPRAPRRVRQARSAPDDQEPGDVRRRGRQRLHDAAVRPRAGHRRRRRPPGFIARDRVWLWFTVLFANFAEAMAEGRGKAQADSLRKARKDVPADACSPKPRRDAARSERAVVAARARRRRARRGRRRSIPGDGEIVEGVASVDESAITGESAPVIRESGGDRSAVTGGTTVLSDWLVVRITAKPGETLPRPDDRDGRGRQAQEDAERDRARHPARRADDRVPARHRDAVPFSRVRGRARPGQGTPVTLTVLVALLVCLIPTTIGGLLSAIGIAGMDRMIQANVIATSRPRGRGRGRRRRAAARQDRHDHARQPPGDRVLPGAGRHARRELAEAARARVARRRHARGQEHRRARRRRSSAARSTAPDGATSGAVHRADPHERRRLRRAARSARARPTRSRATSSRSAAAARRGARQRRRGRQAGRDAAGRRRRRHACSASSSSRTS